MEFDKIDQTILDVIQDRGRITNAELAELAGISPPAMLERVRKLESEGVIKKYVALVDPAALDRSIAAFVSVSLAVHQLNSIEEFTEAVNGLKSVLECHHLSGESDFLLKVVTRDIAAYEDFILNKLTRIPGVNRIQSSFVLSTMKLETKIPVTDRA